MRVRAAAGSRRAIASTIAQMRFGGALLERSEVDAERHEAIDLRETAIDQLHGERVARRRGDGDMEAHVGGFGVAVLRRRLAAAAARVGRFGMRQRREWRS